MNALPFRMTFLFWICAQVISCKLWCQTCLMDIHHRVHMVNSSGCTMYTRMNFKHFYHQQQHIKMRNVFATWLALLILGWSCCNADTRKQNVLLHPSLTRPLSKLSHSWIGWSSYPLSPSQCMVQNFNLKQYCRLCHQPQKEAEVQERGRVIPLGVVW